MKGKRNQFVEAELLSDNNYNQVENLSRFLTEQGKVINRRSSKLSIRQHAKMTKELKRARLIGLLPFTASYD